MASAEAAEQQQQTLATNRALDHASSQSEVSSGQNVGGSSGEGITPGMTSLGENSIELFSPENLDSTLGKLREGCMKQSFNDVAGAAFEHSGPMQGVDKISEEVKMQPHAGQNVAPPHVMNDLQTKKMGMGRE